jgi:hypothetical protein
MREDRTVLFVRPIGFFHKKKIFSGALLYLTKYKLFQSLINEALRHENVWGSGI